MLKLEFNKVLAVALILLTLSVIAGIAAALLQGSKTQHLTLAAGSASGESYIIGNALKKVVERHHSHIRIVLLETAGTVENLQMLEEGRAQLATAQADVLPGPTARIVARLYDDTFQLVVPRDSRIESFVGLRAKVIALAPSGGQFQSFLRVAEHFGLRQSDFNFVGSTDASADELFLNGQADAAFRVRTLGNPSIQHLMRSGQVRFLPIEHAAAMKIKYPAFEPSVIPQGAYLGNPPVPAQDLPTVSIHRNLLARETTNEGVIRAITQVLIERRTEIMEEIPAQMTEVRLLLGQVRRPDPQAGLSSPPHAGATSFYDKDKPSFLQANADYVGLLVTLVLMIGSWIWEFKRWIQKKQKTAADRYSNRVVALMGSAQDASSAVRVEDIWRELLTILTEAVHDLDADKLSEESFNSFRSILNIALDVTKERRAILAFQHSEQWRD